MIYVITAHKVGKGKDVALCQRLQLSLVALEQHRRFPAGVGEIDYSVTGQSVDDCLDRPP
jgi:hypothetical protein